MKKLILTVLLLMTAIAGVTCPQAAAQSNQAFPQKVYYASDYGTWQVQGQTPNTYQFQPSSLCVIPQPAGGNFDAFNVNGPVYIQDAVTANSEVLTPHFVNINATLCNVALTTAHSHYSFALMSGTAGLQEALNTIAAQIPYPTQVILDRNWYTALGGIPGQTASAVIGSVKGNAAAILADVTQAPTQFYKWNGSTYIAVAPAGASIPANGGILMTSGVAGQAAASSALPSNTTAVTQSPGDSSTKVATDAFVAAINPNTNAGDVWGAGGGGAPARIAGNTGAVQAVLTSTAGTQAGPTTKTCANASSGSGNSLSCTWSSAPAAGEFIACSVTNVGTNTFTVSDSASDSYTNYGSGHLNSTTNNFIQTSYFGPVTTPVTTSTVTVPSSGSFLTILCDSATGVATSPTDGQAVADSTSAPFSSGAITTTQNGDYIFCGGIGGSGSGFSAGTGFTGGAQHSPFFNSLNEYQLQATAGVITPAMNGTVATGATLMCSAFKSASTTPTTDAFSSTINIADVQADNTAVVPIGADPTGVADSRVAIQAAITTAIAEQRPVYIPAGLYTVSCPGGGAPALTFPSHSVKISGLASTENGYPATAIKTSGGPCTTLQVGPGVAINSDDPPGYVRDLLLEGTAIPGSPTGDACLQLNAIPALQVDSVACLNHDIAYDLINNNYGAMFTNIRASAAAVNVCVNLRQGTQSGSDLYFPNTWCGGKVASVSVSPNGGGYHFVGGQFSAEPSSICDTCGAVIIGKDYLTGATGGASIDFYKSSFEATERAWVFRSFGQPSLDTWGVSINADGGAGAPALGILKATGFGPGQIAFDHTEIEGYYTNTIPGCPLISIAGINNAIGITGYNGLNISEVGTHVDSGMTLCGTNPYYVQSMFAQSGIQQYANIQAMGGLSIPGSRNLVPLTLLNDNTGNLQTSSDSGCLTGGSCVTSQVALVPQSPLASDLLYVNATAKNLARLPGNTTNADQVLVSHASAVPVPTTQTCANQNSASPLSCTWSAAPQAGQYVVCTVQNSSSATYAVSDSGSNAYTNYGGVYSATTFGAFFQTFYFGPLAASIATSTVTVTGTPSNTTILCNAVSNLATSSVTDGQCTTSSSTGTLTCGSAITTTANGDYVFCSSGSSTGGDTLTPGSGFTAGSGHGNPNFLNQYQVQGSAGAITPTMNVSGAANTGMVCSAFKAGTSGTAGPPTLKNSPALDLTNMFAGGTPPTITGCGTITAQHGGTLGGDFTTSTAGTCTAVFALPTAPTGWHCDVTDITKHVAANIMMQSATSTTSCTVTGTTAASDVLSFSASAY